MAQDNKDNIKNLYDALKGEYNLGSEEDFRKSLENSDNRKNLYKAISNEYNLGSEDDFNNSLGYGVYQEQSNAGSQAQQVVDAYDASANRNSDTATQAPTTQDAKPQEPWKPTAQERLKMDAGLYDITKSAQRTVDDFNKYVDNLQEYGRSFSGGHTVPGGLRFNPQSKKMERTYLTPTGERTFNKAAADAASREYRDAVDMTVGGQIRRAQNRLQELKDKAAARVQELQEKWKQDYENNDAPLAAVLAADTYVPSIQSDQTYRALQAAIRQTEERIKTLGEQQDRDNGVDVGFWRGFGRVAGDIRTWDFGIGDMMDAMTMMNAADPKRPQTEQEKAANQEMLRSVYENQQAEAMYGGNADFWNRAGMMTGYMPSFMVDFIATGGGFEGINLATRAAGKAATKMLGKEAVEQMAKQGLKTYVKNNGLQEAGNWTIKALGTTVDDLLIRAPLMTNTVQGMDTAADIIDRKLGDVTVDENGNYDFTNDKTWGSAIWQGEANSIVENYSEMFGTHLHEVASLKNLGKLANVIGAKRLSGVLVRADAGALGGITDGTRRIFEQMGVSDYLGEVSEEYYGQLWRTMLNLDDAYQQNPDGTRTNLFATKQFHGDIWGGMALSMGLMGAGKATMSAANYLSMKHDVNKADAHASELLTPDVWEPLRATIDMATNDNVGDVAEVIVNDKEMTGEEKAAVLNYMERSLYLRGANLAELVKSRGGEQDENAQRANDSYMDGYNARSDEEMQDTRNMYELQRQKAEQTLTPEQLDEIDNDPIGSLHNLGDDESTNRVVIDYINAKQVYDGMLQRVRDDIDGRIDQSNTMIDSCTNRTTGMIQGATMKVQDADGNDRRVYVLDGNLATYEDGTGIDKENSDDSIIIRDAETGAIEMVSPDAIFSMEQPVDPETEKQTAAEAIRQQFAQEAANRIDGTVAFRPGDTYTVTNESGQAAQIQVVPNKNGLVDNGDGTVNVSSDGGQTVVPMRKEDIQAMVDATNRTRVIQAEQQREAMQQPQAQEPQTYSLNDELTLLDKNGNEVRGSITSDINDDGQYEVYTESPINGRRVNLFTADELNRLSAQNAENSLQNGGNLTGNGGNSVENTHQENVTTVNQEVVNNATVDDLRRIDSAYVESYYRDHPEKVAKAIALPAQATADYINGKLTDRDYLIALGYSTGKGSWLDEDATDEEIAARAGEKREKYLPYVIMPQTQGASAESSNNGDENIPQNGNIEPQNIPAPTETLQAGANGSSAFERIPKDEQGQPIYEQADPDTAWDAIVEQAEGNEAMAQNVADSMVADKEAELKKIEKAKPKGGTTVAEKIAAERERKNSVEQAKANLALWQRIAQTSQRRKQAALMEQSKAAEEAARLRRAEEEKLRAEREEAERIRREALNGVPDFVEDTPQDARARGYRRVNGEKVDRQQSIPARQGKEVQVKFDDNNIPTGHVALIEAGQLQPSHMNGVRNPRHFLDEAQPKERKDNASVMSARKIAANIRPEEITSSVTAYTGAPTVNTRGEVIQGNNRSAALREMWTEQPEQAAIYKQYLADHAAGFGLTPEDVETMQQPVLVNMIDVPDENAITLGQFEASDTESGGKERIKPVNAVKKMGTDMRLFANQLLSSPDEELTFTGLVDRNGTGVLRWMQTKGYITPTQYRSSFDSKGNLTEEAKNDLKGIMYQSIFQRGSTHLEEMFNVLPAKAQKAILATAYRDYDSPNAERLNAEIQNSISAYYALSQNADFLNAKNYKEAALAVETWKRQYVLDDVTGESYLPSERYSNFALLLATMYKGQTQTFIQNTFKNIYDLVQGTQEATLFEKPDNTPRTLVEAINETLSNLSDELLLNGNFIYNGQRRNNVLAGSGTTGQPRGQGSAGSTQARGRAEDGAGTAADKGRTVQNDDERGGQGDLRYTSGRQPNNLPQEAVSEKVTPIGESDFGFVYDQFRGDAEGAIRQLIKMQDGEALGALHHKDIGDIDLVWGKAGTKKSDGYGLAKLVKFHPEVLDNLQNILDGMGVTKRSENRIQLEDANYQAAVRLTWNGEEKIWLLTAFKKKETSEPTNSRTDVDSNLNGVSDDTATQHSSDVSAYKGIEKSAVTKTIGEKVAQAEAETEQNPTEAQKEAGNYKKGHVRIGQFDITVENPRGSVRRGTDPSGKPWETTMHNTYGYIRGTEGVDGDHIDVFLTDDIDGWNGRRVYVVDQYNEDGTFDEHKVMLGFNDEDDAREAYFSNYSDDWAKNRKIVMTFTNLEDFEKWINSSHRKTKPFAEYKSVRNVDVRPVSGYNIEQRYHKKKNTYIYAVKFTEQMPRDQFLSLKKRVKDFGGYYSSYGKGGFIFETEETGRRFAEAVLDTSGEKLDDAQPLSLTDMQQSSEPAKRQVDVEGLMQAIYQNGEAKLSDHFVVGQPGLTEKATSGQTDNQTQENEQQPQQSEDNGYGANNKLVSRDRYEELKKRMRQKLGGQLNMGIDPEILAIGTEMAAYHIEAGARKFADYARHMIDDLGDAIRPYLKAFYNGARDLPEVQKAGYAEEMTPYDEVRIFDTANFDKAQGSAMATAEMVVAEQEAQKDADIAKEQLANQRNEQRRKEDEQRTADTEVVADEAEAVASQAESRIEAATDEKEVNDAVRKVDEQLDKVNRQLALLGYYEAEPVESDFNEAYGYMRNAEKKAVKDANSLANRLVKDLGIDPKTIVDKKGKRRRNIATANIAPIGGNISIHLPLGEKRELYISIQLDKQDGDNLKVTGGMLRVENPNPERSEERYLSSNDYFPEDEMYQSLLSTAQQLVKHYVPNFVPVSNENQEASTKVENRQGKHQKKQDEPKIADLFSAQTEEVAPETKEVESADNTTVNAENTEVNRIFADAVKTDMLSALDSGTKPYRSILDLRKRAAGLGMEVDNDGRTDILLQELVEDGLVRAAREIVNKHGRDRRESYDLICKLYDMQPTIAARSSNRIKMQQYSTPLPMAWNVAHFAMSGKKDGKVLEPTAGNGMLVFAVPVNQVHVNELDETRLDNLREQGFAEVTQQDAIEPFEGGQQYDVVIANPPFGKREAVNYDGKLIPGLDPQITLNALASMKDDGKAAIIIGGNMEYGSNGGLKSMKPFFTYLYDHYNVKGVVDMDGKLYAKQGTTYPTRMILIDGRRSDEERAQTTVYPPVESKAIRRAESFDDLYDIIDEVINSKEKTNGTEILRSQQGQLVSVADQPSRNTDGKRHTKQSRTDDTSGRGRRTSVEGTQEQSEVVLRGEQRTDIGNGETRRGTGGNTTGGSRGIPEPDIQRVGRVGASTDRVGLNPEPKKRNLTEEKLPYRPHNSAFSLESVAPAAMVEAMDNVLSQIEAENGNIDEFVRKELGYDTIEETHQALAAEQVDSVAMAIYQMKKGQALIIGDQTGVGKGRQMAALIRWAVKRGEKPIFITQKADLFSDIYRDLVDIGSGDLVPFIFNSPSAKENKGEMVDANGKVVYKGLPDAKMKKVMATGKLPDEYDYAVLTYSQVNSGDEISQEEAKEAAKKRGGRTKKSKASKDGKSTPKATFLRAIAEDNYLFLDESHTAAGTSNTGAYLQSILRSAKAATFASATFAKRPDTMPLYAIRTAMSQAKVEPDKLIGIIEKGGVTLQEIMSRELTNAGQMVRRERDMSDVVTDWKTIDDPATVKRARENYDRTIAAFNAIIKFQEDYVKPMVEAMDKELAVYAESAGIKRGTDKLGVENVPFASKTYNYTKQLMLALKVDAIADEVEAEIKAGRHPVIALESTMESTISDYSPGNIIEEPTFSASLLRGLDTVMQYTIKDENGKETHAYYTPKQLGAAGEKAYYELQDFIRESTSDIFISPLDAIIERLHGMGYKVGELTGRNMYVERDDEGRVVVKRRTDKDKKRMQREFNSGELDVLILNKSASTGISLHASEKFSDQRQRTMIIAQPLSDINDYMQMIGRIDRTGQVHRGYYINLGLPVPAENRFLMMLSTKLKSLNANTTTSQDSESNDVEAPDLLNKYGSQVVVEYLRDNPEIYEKMGSPLKKTGQGGGSVQTNELDEYKPQEDDARKITGYVALLTTKEQEDFYDDVVRRYNELIKYLNDTGSNDLKITVMPLRAKTLNKRVSSEGIDPTGTNPFARNSYVEQVEMDVLRKPMKATEIRKTIEQVNKGKRPEDYVRQVIATIEKEDEARIAAEEARYERSKVRAQEDIAKQTEKINRQQKRTAEEKQAAIADYVRETNENVETKHKDNMVRLNTNSDMLKQRLHMFEVGKSYLMPDNLESMVFDFSTPAIFCGYKAKDSRITASTTLAVFATLDGRRRMEIKLSQPEALRSIHKTTNDNWDAARSTTLENWDSQIPTGTRKTGFIMTGNILQAIADTQDEHGGYPGQLISYTDIDGNVHDGILMPDKWNTSMLKTSGAPIISRLKQIKDYMPVTSHDGKVEITGSSWVKVYYLTVPKTKKDGAVYYENKVLLRAVNGSNFYPYRGKLRADIPVENIEKVVRELSKMGVKVKEETNEDDVLYRNGYGTLTDDELIFANDPTVKMTGRQTRTARQRRAFAERERQRMVNAVQELAETLHLDNVDIVTDASTLQGRRAKAKGFYSRGTGRITVVIPNHTSVYDVEQTLLHEAVAHYGLRELFGEHFDTFLDNVFQNADENVRCHIVELAEKRGWDFRTATEEYLASLAEDTNFENINASWWQKIKELFLRMLHKIGFENFSGVTLSDNELRYILWRSYENLAEPGRYRSILGEAEDVAKQNELKVGNYAESTQTGQNAAEIGNTDSGDDLFRDNENDVSAIYERGVADTFWNRLSEGWYDYLRSVGVLQDALQKAMGRKLDDFENVLLHALHKTSVDKAQWDKLKKNYIDPLSKSLAAIVDGKKTFRDHTLTQDDVEIYLNCKHGLERNDKFAMRDAEQMRDERIKKANDELAKENRDAKNAMDRTIRRADKQLQDGEIDNAKYNQLVSDAKEEYDKSVKEAEDAHEKAIEKAEKSVTKDYQKNRERDYSGLTEIFDPEGDIGYTNAELEDMARQYVADMEQAVPKPELDDLWDKIHKINTYSLKKSYESGIISKQTYESTKDMFDYYVPLRGFNKETANDVYDYITESDIPIEQVMKHAEGRTSRAKDLIATMMNMAHSSIVSGNRNLVKQKLLNLALNADNDLLTVGNQWYENDGMGGWIPMQEPPIRDGMTAKEAREIVEQFEENMKEREKNGEVRRMRKGVSLPVRIVGKRAENEHGVRVKRNGQEYVVWINGNPKAAQAINGILNPETERGWVLDHIHKLNRFVSKNVTSLRPNFLLSNLKRDILSSNMVGFVKYGLKYTRMFDKFVKDNLSVIDVKSAKAGKMRGIYALYHRYNNGTLDMNDKRDRYFKEFMENGGETGYSQMWSIDDYEKQIRRVLNQNTAKEKFRNGWQAVGDAVEFANRGIENVCRFAAYMASRESGMSVLQSITDAKEASVNFNRKGSGAMGNNAARAVFMFLNPAIQGFMQHNKLLMKYPKRMLAIDGGLIALGVLVGLANCLIWGGGDDDKEVEDDYFNINPFVRRNNIVLRIGQHEYAKIDLPQELRPWYGLGEIAYAAMTGHMKHDNVGVELFSQLTQTIPLNPITGNTILDPNESLGVGVIRNLTGATSLGSITDAYLFDKDYAGNKITKASEYNKLDPEWKRAGRGTSSLMVGTTRMLNNLTGGNDYKKGFIDLNPSRLEHVATSMLGGRVEFFKQLWTTGQALVGRDEDERNNMRNYPFVSTSYIDTDNSYNRNYRLNNEFDWYQHEFEQERHEYNGLKNDKKNVFEKAEEFDAFIQTPEYKIYRRFKKYDRRLKKQFEKLSDETDDDKRKKINKKITDIKKDAVEEMQRISK